MNTIRDAILKAADHIEQNPQSFNFRETFTPNDECGTGCALGWIAYFLNIKDTYDSSAVGIVKVASLLLTGEILLTQVTAKDVPNCLEFYNKMHTLDFDWKKSAVNCAKALRLYADKFYPEVQSGIPDSVKAIFEVESKKLTPIVETV